MAEAYAAASSKSKIQPLRFIKCDKMEITRTAVAAVWVNLQINLQRGGIVFKINLQRGGRGVRLSHVIQRSHKQYTRDL